MQKRNQRWYRVERSRRAPSPCQPRSPPAPARPRTECLGTIPVESSTFSGSFSSLIMGAEVHCVTYRDRGTQAFHLHAAPGSFSRILLIAMLKLQVFLEKQVILTGASQQHLIRSGLQTLLCKWLFGTLKLAPINTNH